MHGTHFRRSKNAVYCARYRRKQKLLQEAEIAGTALTAALSDKINSNLNEIPGEIFHEANEGASSSLSPNASNAHAFIDALALNNDKSLLTVPNINVPLPLITDSDVEISDENKSKKLQIFLRHWSLTNDIRAVQLNSLIRGLNEIFPDIHLPRDTIYCGTCKPNNIERYFQDFIPEINDLISNGLVIGNTNIKICLLAFTCDAPARSFIKCTIGHNGTYGCDRCDQKGTYYKNRIVYLGSVRKERTNDEFKNRVCVKHHVSETPLLRINEINIIKDFALDYMHLCYLGVMRKLLYWVKKCDFKSVRLPLRLRHIISKRLKYFASSIPSELNRKPRSLDDLLRFKATELRLILLYLGPDIFCGVLDKNVYDHFILFHVAIRILLSPKYVDTDWIDLAKEILTSFVDNFINLYGRDSCIYNVHSLIHLADDSSHFKTTLNEISCFPFKSFLGRFKKNDKETQSTSRTNLDFVKETSDLSNSGIIINNKSFDFVVNMLICDLPAKSFVLNITGHNGYFSCTKCTLEGDFSNTLYFPEVEYTKRANDSFRLHLQPEHHNGRTILENIPNFNMVESVPIDYMHCILLGVMKRILYHKTFGWVFGKPPFKLQASKVNCMAQKLQQIKLFIPFEFSQIFGLRSDPELHTSILSATNTSCVRSVPIITTSGRSERTAEETSEESRPGPISTSVPKTISCLQGSSSILQGNHVAKFSSDFKKLVTDELSRLHLKVDDNVNSVLQLLRQKEVNIKNASLDEIHSLHNRLPVQSKQDLIELEEWLQDKDHYKLALNEFQRFGRQSLAQATRKILYRTISNDAAMSYSWDGARGKNPFKTLALAKCLLDANKIQYPTAKEMEIVNVIKMWLVKAKERAKKVEIAVAPNDTNQ
ncbi:unnamed protein product [Ceutorhynchus assimilis]|uniref:DUF4806 domain-containing protein n=1 Tax=Ceutorhynchus assimilis TaxID=467358 RepID=A0A9N9N358_9CUCU|nr:unnamed protein product [Ceutorhynchus assimilis]